MLKFQDFELLREQVETSIPDKVQNLISKFVSLKKDIRVEPWPEIIKKDGVSDELMGIRMYYKGRLFRINWKQGTTSPTSIDIWDWSEGKHVMPTVTFLGNSDLFLSMAGSIIGFISKPKLAYKKIGNKIIQESEESTPRIIDAPNEETYDTMQSDSPENEELTIFDDLRSLTKMVIDNINPSLIVCGNGGIGKTHTVINTLKEYDLEKDDEYVIIKGASTPLSMYKALYDNRNKIIIFDDCDSIFKDPDGVNILKAALDSYDEREISWLSRSTYDPKTGTPTEKVSVPNRFIFEGQIIFITNKDMSELDQAVKSRSYPIEIKLTPKQLLDTIEKGLPGILPTVSLDIKKEVFNFMKTEYSNNEAINFRTIIKAIKIRLTGDPNWKNLAKKYSG